MSVTALQYSKSLYNHHYQQLLTSPPWVKENPRVSTQHANFVSTVVKTDGQTNISVNELSEPPGNHPLSRELPMAKELFWRKLVLRQNNLILLSENVSVYNSSRTERSTPPPFPSVFELLLIVG
jgi:hypothetical protein